MKRKLLLSFLVGGVIFSLFYGCRSPKFQGAGPVSFDQLYEKMSDITTILDTATFGETNNTYPLSSETLLKTEKEKLEKAISMAIADLFYLQYEVDSYVISADKTIDLFKESLQLILDPGTLADLQIFGKDQMGYIDFGKSSEFGAGQQWTIEVWIKYDKNFYESAMGDYISTFFYDGKTDKHMEGWTINFLGGQLRTTIGMGPQPERVLEYGGVHPDKYGAWMHLATTYDGAANSKQLKMYIDGEVFWEKDNDIKDPGGSLQSYRPNTRDLRMWAFARPTAPGNCMTGYIKNFRKWNNVKSKDEIKALMTTEVGGTESGLVFAWNFTEVPEDDQNIVDETGGFSAKIVGVHKWHELK